jgi:hypothetical protein
VNQASAPPVADGGQDAGVDRLVHQRLVGLDVDKHGERRAPGALPRDQPVGPVADHAPDAVPPRLRVEHGAVDSPQRRLPERVAADERLVHADEPLRVLRKITGAFDRQECG